MSYEYAKERDEVFTERGQKMFLGIRDKANYLCDVAGACKVEKAISGQTGSNWSMFACIDRLVELGEFVFALSGDVGTPYQIITKRERL
jgi:hypothetical protein